MRKSYNDRKVKKTLVRDCEQRIRQSLQRRVIRDVNLEPTLDSEKSTSSRKENELNEPTICSSAVLANYLCEVKNSLPSPFSVDDLNFDKNKLSSLVTKKLNFHFNDQIYKNLIELNANIEEVKFKKEKRPNRTAAKRDMEPSIDDFIEDKKELDVPPNVPILKPKFKPVRKFEYGQLHKLASSFENL